MGILYKKHELYPESILIREFWGKVDVDEIIDSWNYLIDNKLITLSTKGVINDLNHCELIMNIAGFKRLTQYMKQQEILRKIKLAAVCNNPTTIVFPTLGEEEENDLKIKPFTTMNAAVSWALTD